MNRSTFLIVQRMALVVLITLGLSACSEKEDMLPQDGLSANEAVGGGGAADGTLVGDALGPVTIQNGNMERRLKNMGVTDVDPGKAGFQVNVNVYDDVNESRNGQGTRIVFQEATTHFTIGRTNGAGDNGTLDEAFVQDYVVYGVGTDFRGNRANWTPSFNNPGIWTVNKTVLPDCIGHEFKEDRFPSLQNGGYGTSLDVRGGKIVAVRGSMDIRPKGWTVVGKDQRKAAGSTRIRLTIVDDNGNRYGWVPNRKDPNNPRNSKVIYQLQDSKTYCDTYLNRFHPNKRYDFSPEEVQNLNDAVANGATKLKVEFFVFYQNPLTGVIPAQGTVPNRATGPDGNIEVKYLELNGRMFK